MVDAFSQSGYGGDAIGIGKKCAVLIVDFQKAFTDARSVIGRSEHVGRAVEQTAKLISLAHRLNIPIASCRTAWANHDDMAYWKVSSVFDGGFYEGSEFTDIDPRLSDPKNIYELTKTAPSIFFKTPLMTWLVRKGVDTTIITGCTTSGCVRASVTDSFSYGFRTIVAEDCCGDQDADAHRDNLRDMERRYADIMTLAELETALTAKFGEPSSPQVVQAK